MMQCGHAANATDQNGKPCCVICAGIQEPQAHAIAPPMDFRGRKAQCSYCHREAESSADLAFFEIGYWKDGNHLYHHDSYYCGCRGWD